MIKLEKLNFNKLIKRMNPDANNEYSHEALIFAMRKHFVPVSKHIEVMVILEELGYKCSETDIEWWSGY